jgi:hypothetical protein
VSEASKQHSISDSEVNFALVREFINGSERVRDYGVAQKALDDLEEQLEAAEREQARWLAWSNGQYPDDSPGDVIHALSDGTITLDDGITTWNPLRALAWIERRREDNAERASRAGAPYPAIKPEVSEPVAEGCVEGAYGPGAASLASPSGSETSEQSPASEPKP